MQLIRRMRAVGLDDDLLFTVFVAAFMFLVATAGGFALMFGAPLGEMAMVLAIGWHVGLVVSLADVGRKLWFTFRNLGA